MTKIKFNFGKPLPIPIVSMFVRIYTVIMIVLLAAITYVAYRNNTPQLLIMSPVIAAYVITLYAYLATRLRKDFKEKLSKTEKRPEDGI